MSQSSSQPSSHRYAGVGSRETPDDILDLMSLAGKQLYRRGYILRSGGARGADTAWEKYVPSNGKEIYVLYGRSQNGRRIITDPDILDEAERMARSIHPAWHRCDESARRLHTRNVFQILGADLNSPSKFVLYWAKENNGVVQGGTATAVHLAREHDIPTFNLAYEENRMRVFRLMGWVSKHWQYIPEEIQAPDHPERRLENPSYAR